MLASLKAAGLGVTLKSADYVFLILLLFEFHLLQSQQQPLRDHLGTVRDLGSSEFQRRHQ